MGVLLLQGGSSLLLQGNGKFLLQGTQPAPVVQPSGGTGSALGGVLWVKKRLKGTTELQRQLFPELTREEEPPAEVPKAPPKPVRVAPIPAVFVWPAPVALPLSVRIRMAAAVEVAPQPEWWATWLRELAWRRGVEQQFILSGADEFLPLASAIEYPHE